MSSRHSTIPKTGLADRMRAWMKAQTQPFTAGQVCDGIGVSRGAEHARVRNTLGDFEDRGEILRQPPDKRMRLPLNRYRYNRAWQGGKDGVIKSRIFKAMYVSGTFAVTDLVRLCQRSDEKELTRAWTDKVVRRLRRAGHIANVGRRLCAHGAGAEALYHVADRDKFRLEVMR